MAATEFFRDEDWAGLAARLTAVAARPAPLRVLVVDDDLLFAELVSVALELSDRFEVVGRAENGRAAIEQAAWVRPDVIVMDIEMPVLGGIDAIPRVLAAAPGARVVVVSGSQSAEDVVRARDAGAVGFLSKRESTDELVEAFERVVFRAVPLRARHSIFDPAERLPMF